jgi:hypothetical protein
VAFRGGNQRTFLNLSFGRKQSHAESTS